MSRSLLSLAGLSLLAAGLLLSAPAAHAQTYVGSYAVEDGVYWQTNPICYTPQDVAALLFGGSASDYAISTTGSDVSLINNMGWEDGWGNTSHLKNDLFQSSGSLFGTPVAENYKLQIGSGYNDPFGGPAFSAYVSDHRDPDSINYVFRINSTVPEPGSVALLVGMGVSGAGFLLRKRRK